MLVVDQDQHFAPVTEALRKAVQANVKLAALGSPSNNDLDALMRALNCSISEHSGISGTNQLVNKAPKFQNHV